MEWKSVRDFMWSEFLRLAIETRVYSGIGLVEAKKNTFAVESKYFERWVLGYGRLPGGES